MIDLTPLVQTIIALSVTVITAFVIPVIKSKTTVTQQQELRSWVQIAVEAAEHLLKDQSIDTKLGYVHNFLAQKGYEIDAPEVENMIHSAVYQIKNTQSNQTTPLS